MIPIPIIPDREYGEAHERFPDRIGFCGQGLSPSLSLRRLAAIKKLYNQFS
jgi:hypothetical protein